MGQTLIARGTADHTETANNIETNNSTETTGSAELDESVRRAIEQGLPEQQLPRVLSIAGSDPSGGAGIQADLKSIAALGGYGMAVITALTAQNTRGVSGIHLPPSSFVTEQLEALSADIRIDAVKIGMLGNVEIIRAVAGWLEANRPPLVVLDPVMVATSGDRLLTAEAETALRELFQFAHVITPNLPELAVLARAEVPQSWDAAVSLARRFATENQITVVLKGGHLDGELVTDAVIEPGAQVWEISSERLSAKSTHGTGCSLSAGLATVQAVQPYQDWSETLTRVKGWLHEAIRRGPELHVGSGHGPVHHFHELQLGRITTQWWLETADLRQGILDLPFIQQMLDGTLSESELGYYLAQDALYLADYSRVLSAAAQLAPTEAEQLFWTKSALNCLEVEAQLHRDWLSLHPAEASNAPGPVTASYLNQLLAAVASGSYAQIIAAALPCFWIYAWVGEQLGMMRAESVKSSTAAKSSTAHLYAAWLDTYADPEFAESTMQAIRWVDQAAASATPRVRDLMRTAFSAASKHELEFFDAPTRRAESISTAETH